MTRQQDNQVQFSNLQARFVSRRSFLQVAAIGIGGATLAACSPAAGTEPAGEVSTLRVGWTGAPATLDPATASADVEIAFLNAAYDYLIDTNAASELVPRLATAWEVSDDGLTYTLTIAEGVKFHDGSDLTLDDILWTLDRLRAPDASTVDLFTAVDDVAAGEGNTIVFTMNTTAPDFLYNLSDNRTVILKQDATDIGSAFNGTGPFKLDEYVANDRAVFSPNAEYFGGAPAVGLEFIYFADTEAAINALRGGVVDGLVRMDNASFLSLSEEDGYNAISVATNGHDLIRLRADRGPGESELVRRAFKLATDREAIFERIQLGFGAIGRDTPIGPLYGAYYTEEFDLPPHDPEEAASLLAQAGYEDGLDMTLVVPNLPDRVALAEALAAQWEEAGIRVTIDPQEEAVYYAASGWLEVDLAITPWGSRPVPQIYLDVAYRTDAVWNEAHLSDPELDTQIEIAGTSLDEAERKAAYTEIQRILNERGPVVIPYFFAQFGVFTTAVQGVEVHPFGGRTNFNRASL